MKIAVVDTGYVGLLSGIYFFEMWIDVTCADVNRENMENLRKVSFHLLPSNSVNYLIDMGKHTLGVYLVQTVILEMILPSILHLHSFDTLMGHLFLVPLISLLTLIVCDVVTRICYRNRYISLLFMGK